MTAVTYHDFDTEAFNMDALGNRTGDQTLRDEGTVDFTVDSATNRYSSVGGNSISHDDAGNMTVDKDGYQYTYDYENRVVRIEDVNDVEVATYAYDALGRRIRKSDESAQSVVLYYHNPEWQVLAEYNGADALQRYYVYGNYIDEVLLVNDGTDDYYYAHDHLYSVAALIDENGDDVERYEYDAYGKATIFTDMTDWDGATPTTASASAYGNAYLFTGRRLDVLDSANLLLLYYRHRTYDTYTARFLQHDPLGYVDGMNLYEYVESQPSIADDPYGLWGQNIHYTWTKVIAGNHWMWSWAANRVAYYDEYVDTEQNPVTQDKDVLSWHFDLPHSGVWKWGRSDSRFKHSEHHFSEAVGICQSKETMNARVRALEALRHLGTALHPAQDFVAHGTWIPFPSRYHWSPVHPSGSDDFKKDFAHKSDGILRDWKDIGGKPKKPFFVTGNKRSRKTLEMTDEYLFRFRDAIKGTPCECEIYRPEIKLP